MKHRIDPLYADPVGKSIISAQKRSDPLICLILYCKDSHIHIFVQAVQQVNGRIGDIIYLCTADINVAPRLRDLSYDQIEHDHYSNDDHRSSYAPGSVPGTCRAEQAADIVSCPADGMLHTSS